MAAINPRLYFDWEDISFLISPILETVSSLYWGRLLILSNLSYQREGTPRSSSTLLRILLVEDNDMIATVHKNFLSELGCNIDVATNGAQALTLGTTYEYDLILLDIGLSDISGVEVARTLRFSLKNECPHLIAITALSSEETITACLEAGIEQVITKPVGLNGFKNILSTFNKHSLQEGQET